MVLPFALGAQAPVRYRVSEIVPATVAAANGRPSTNRETVSIVTIASRDSAGGVIWSLRVDSTDSAVVPADSATPGLRTRVVIRRPSSYRAYVRGGRVLATEIDGQAAPFVFNHEQPAWSLLQMVQGVASLPVTGLPAAVGETRTASSIAERTVPTGVVRDSSVVQWTRTTARLIAGTLMNTSMSAGARGPRASIEGTIEIAFDTDGSLGGARWLTQRKRVIGGAGGAPSRQEGGQARVVVERIR